MLKVLNGVSPQVYSLSCTQSIYKKNNFTAPQMKNKHVIVDERLSRSEKKAMFYFFDGRADRY